MICEDLAALHGQCFQAPDRPWSAAEFEGLLRQDTVFLQRTPHGFALGRRAGPEVEILTLAVDPKHRRQGRGTAILKGFERQARSNGPCEIFLEVAETNTSARALYAKNGYGDVGSRRGYYPAATGPGIDAVLMRKILL